MLGRYALYEKIASGGMASVHLGRLLGPVGFSRTVAIKRMHPQFAGDPEFVSMFLDEARLAARIRHPHVVPTLDVVATEGELFLVMDFVQGESLARLIRATGLKEECIPHGMVAPIMAGVLHGLHAAHEATNEHGEPLNIVHRDVSPHNVIVGTDGVARVLDFGVAKAVGRLQTTRDGQLKGKMAYMAPEQVRGNVSRLTDIYAASVVLWEALAGRRLFYGDNDAHVLEQVLRGCTDPPSKYHAGLPAALDEVTMRGLSVDPTKRFQTAREMARALEVATSLATPSMIGEWVETTARETLLERSVRIASIESDSAARVPESLSLKATAPAPASVAPVAGDGGATQLSSDAALPAAPRRSRAILTVAGAITVVATVAAIASWHSSALAPPAAAATDDRPTAHANPPPEAPSAAPPPSAAAAPAGPSSTDSAPVPSAHRAAPPTRPAAPAAPPPKSAEPARKPAKPNPLDLPVQ